MSQDTQPSANDGVIDAFELLLTARDEPTTLLNIAAKHAHIPLTELRALNPHLDDVKADAVLPAQTRIHLPIRTAQRGESETGLPFVLAEAEARLRRCEGELDALLTAVQQQQQVNNNEDTSTTNSKDVYELPSRRVYSKTEQIVEAMHAEARRQLPEIEAAIRDGKHREQHLHFLVDVDPMKAREAEIEKDFATATATLQSYKPQYAEVMSQPALTSSSAVLAENYLTPATLQTVTDSSEDYCVEHSHRWEFVFCAPHALEPQDAWAVLACQPLTALLDAFECVNNIAPFIPRGAAKNAFLFIHGVFYVDDRHASSAAYEDLSAAIRHFDPALATRAACSDNNNDVSEFTMPDSLTSNREEERHTKGYGACPVRSAAKTTFGELTLKVGELNVLQHLGRCTHYFYLHGVRPLRGCTRTERDAFPHRVMKRKDRAMHCHMCRQFPATIALYADPLSPREPAMYCAVCYELLHGTDSPEIAATYLKVEPEHIGDYFKY